MIKKLLSVLVLVFALSGSVLAQQSMSDQQVLEYVKTGMQQGKDQRQIATELARRGVTQEQAKRVKKLYEQQNGSADKDANATMQNRNRLREKTKTQEDIYVTENFTFDQRPAAGRVVGKNLSDSVSANRYYEGMGMGDMEEMQKDKVYGRDIFETRNLTFEPSVNLATPPNYRLGPGDEVIIDIWGTNQATIRDNVSPDGSITIPDLGLIYLNGMTIAEANQYLRKELNKIYAGLDNEQNPSSQIKVTLGNSRTIQVNVMGEVFQPGTYALSSFSTVFHALYRAGGVNNIGSLRDIRLVRNGETIEHLDVYEFIMQGKMNDDVRLQEGDVIIVSPYQSLVEIVGKVKRPMYYEMKPAETVASLLKYAGGFMGDAYKKAVRIIRKSGREHQVYNVDEMDYSVFRLDDGDLMTVDAVLDRFENKVEVSGAVYRPGLYQLDGEVNTVKQLIKKAEGLRGDAFLARVLLDREREDLTHEMVAVDLEGIMNGTVSDIPLQKNDHLYVPGIHDLKESETVSIYGEVLNPGTFLYSDNLTIEDMIVQAGGLTEAAATTCVSVTRRIKDPKSTAYSSKLAETFTFDIKDGLLTDAGSFYLQPFDVVQVRRSPAYQVQRMVTVAGEVLFSGSYSLLKKNERLSDVIGRAGGITPAAYIKGGRLIRKRNDEERRRETDVLRIAQSGEGKDSISVDKLAISETYAVGIDMEKALFNPGSDYDIVLREGDIVYIPEYVNTVKISGSVMYPNTVTWEKDAKLKHYINMAGGYGENAKKKKAYIIYLNGTVARAKKSDSDLIQPGCEIVVPTKSERKRLQLSEIMGMSSMTATIAAMVATLTNAFK